MSNEIWQVEVGGQVYEASFAELPSWIGEGSLLPEDKVRRGNLRWIEAKKVPALLPFFNAKALGEPMPVVVSDTDASVPVETVVQAVPAPDVFAASPEPVEPVEVLPNVVANLIAPTADVTNPNVCMIHPTVESAFICNDCGNGFCKPCPKSFGGSVKICPMCGALCHPVEQVRAEQRETAMRTNAISAGFGSSDFFNAIAFPFRFKASLFFGALMFMFFSIGQSASSMGGIFMIAASIISYMMANMLWFGVLANTVDNFSQGKLEENFMPSFDDFNLWDDVVHPFFLYIGVIISSFGPFIATMVIGMYLVMNAASSQMNTFQSEIEKLPGTQYYAGREPVEQSKRVKEMVGNISDEHEQIIDEHIDAATTGNVNAPRVDKETRDQEELWRQAQESRKAGLEAAFGKTKETREKEQSAMISGLLSLAAPLVIIGAITFLWGVFFFPAACAVAGYTRTFMASINPLVGLDTIKRLGGTYVKILLMGLTLVIAYVIVSGIFALIFAPFDLPGFGNLPAKALGSMFTFYLSIVFSCILGYALFKNSDKLHLLR
jgi:hypothetical protein